jgi:hypothetical protein
MVLGGQIAGWVFQQVLRTMVLNQVELSAGTGHEVDLAAAGCLPDVQALRQDEHFDQAIRGLILRIYCQYMLLLLLIPADSWMSKSLPARWLHWTLVR